MGAQTVPKAINGLSVNSPYTIKHNPIHSIKFTNAVEGIVRFFKLSRVDMIAYNSLY